MSEAAGAVSSPIEPKSRRQIAREAAAETGVFAVGWIVGAVILWQYGGATVEGELGVFLLALVASIGVPVLLTCAFHRRLPRWGRDPKASFDVRWGLTSLVACFTLPAVTRASGAMDLLTPMQAWLIFLAIAALFSAIDYGTRWLWPNGIASAVAPPLAVVHASSLAILLTASLTAWFAANALVTGAVVLPVTCHVDLPDYMCLEFQPTLPVMPDLGWALLVGMGGTALVAWWTGLARIFYGLIAAGYVMLVFWSELVWTQVQAGSVVIAAPGQVVTLQLVSGALLLVSIAVGSLFRWDRQGQSAERAAVERVAEPT
jgi:hypothetical protein